VDRTSYSYDGYRVDGHYKSATSNRIKSYSHTGRVVTVTRGTVRVDIDIDALVKVIGLRAMASKDGQSLMEHGLIVARVLDREVVSTTTEAVSLPENFIPDPVPSPRLPPRRSVTSAGWWVSARPETYFPRPFALAALAAASLVALLSTSLNA
jgi:hypothetical protein